MEGELAELHDWELLHNSTLSNSVNNSPSNPDPFQTDSEGMIQTQNYLNTVSSDQGSVESDNPSWIDPDSTSEHLDRRTRERRPDSGSDLSVECWFSEFGGGNGEIGDFYEMGKGNIVNSDVGEDVLEEVVKGGGKGYVESDNSSWIDPDSTSEHLGRRTRERWPDSGSDLSEDCKFCEFGGGNGEIGHVSEMDVGEDVLKNAPMGVVKAQGEVEKKSLLWWKAPLELLKMCALRVGPIWTFSMAAAAVMGVVILTRRLYKMKNKSWALQLKVTQNDKVSHFMTRAARLNEAFSMVKRVPVIRPALPMAGGLTQWPVVGLR